jgi:hypothetical protein
LLLEAIRRRRCTLISSREHLSEIYRVLSRPRFVHRYGVSAHYRRRLVSQLYSLAFFVEPVGHLSLCRDPHDDYLLEIALLGRATHLVSEDKDLHDDPNITEFLHQNGIRLVRVGMFVRTLALLSE